MKRNLKAYFFEYDILYAYFQAITKDSHSHEMMLHDQCLS